MLTKWSTDYVEAFFNSDRARNPLFAQFATRFQRDGFVASVQAEFQGVRVTPLDDGLGARIEAATRENLLDIVGAAGQFNGELLPGP